MDPLLVLHAAVTLFLCGLIWTVQTVHYPLFAAVGTRSFRGYELEHQSRITRLVGPAMGLELLSGIVLVARSPQGVPEWAPGIGLVLLAWIWMATMMLAVPHHRTLEAGFQTAALTGLLRANWQRTAGWTLRSFLVLWMLQEAAR